MPRTSRSASWIASDVFTPLTPREAFEAVFEAVQGYAHKGLCLNCAIVMASESTGVSRDRVEDVWIDRQVELVTRP